MNNPKVTLMGDDNLIGNNYCIIDFQPLGNFLMIIF